MDYERFKEVMHNVWTAMMDYWWLTMIIGSVVLAPIAPLWVAIIGICKLVQRSKERHKYDD